MSVNWTNRVPVDVEGASQVRAELGGEVVLRQVWILGNARVYAGVDVDGGEVFSEPPLEV